MYGAEGEIRTLRIQILSLARIPIPSQPHKWCHELDSNQPHTDFQSAALPDELPRHNKM
jgi:hypothetical protein